jgi:hypothetical protein
MNSLQGLAQRLLAHRLNASLVLSILAFGMSAYTFAASQVPYNSVLAIAVGPVDEDLADQGRIDLRLAVVNRGNRDATVFQAELVAIHKEPDGYSWVRIFPPDGKGFEGRVVKAGETVVIALITSGTTRDYHRDPHFSRPIDEKHHEFTVGVRIKSMNAKGEIFSIVYPISQFKVRNDWDGSGPPSEGYTFDRNPHELFVHGEEESIPPVAKSYTDDIP